MLCYIVQYRWFLFKCFYNTLHKIMYIQNVGTQKV